MTYWGSNLAFQRGGIIDPSFGRGPITGMDPQLFRFLNSAMGGAIPPVVGPSDNIARFTNYDLARSGYQPMFPSRINPYTFSQAQLPIFDFSDQNGGNALGLGNNFLGNNFANNGNFLQLPFMNRFN